MTDDALERLSRRLEAFRDEREWGQFHTLKDLAAAISIEAGELQQHFLWQWVGNEDDLLQMSRDAIEDELADVFIHCLNFALRAEIDLASAAERKIDKNEQRYPVDAARGSAKKATD
jgi:NTP pyrophosphatase (non-canonical NTP hydrolase)